MRGTYHTVGHDGDDDDPFKGRPGDKPDKKSPGKKRQKLENMNESFFSKLFLLSLFR